MRAGLLRHRVALLADVGGPTDTGGHEPHYTVVDRVWAQIRPLTARERMEAMQQRDEVSHEVTLRYQPFDPRVRWLALDGRMFDLVGSPIDVDERRRELRLYCRERV